MGFNKEAYAASRARVIERIKSSYDWENTTGFIADGVLRPEIFEQETLRVLCVLAESYDYEAGAIADLEKQDARRKESDYFGLTNGKAKTSRLLATLLYPLLASRERGAKITLAEWRELPNYIEITAENTAILQNTLAKVAWVNVKKASNCSGSTRLNPMLVAQHARMNKAILQEQIEAIAADLIMVFGQITFEMMYELKLLGPKVQCGRIGQVQDTGEGPKILELSHPGSIRGWGYDGIYQKYEAICNQMGWF